MVGAWAKNLPLSNVLEVDPQDARFHPAERVVVVRAEDGGHGDGDGGEGAESGPAYHFSAPG
ncbi:hypothetical protein GCM10010214_00160 [Streptomyces abikoensis]|nr:hypothetical protein GCM10010214_00160 [Streptomyces abikoensis]